MKISVLMTCHNRRLTTLSSLEALFSNRLPKGYTIDVILVDDASIDGTSAAVRQRFPSVHILEGDGDLYWCRGMYRAFEYALSLKYDFYIWLNDDTLLKSEALVCLLNCEEMYGKNNPVIVVGSTVDPDSGALTYGGVTRKSNLRPTTFQKVIPKSEARHCDSMTGNIVLIPSKIADVVGNLDPRFEHAMGDTDYALRAKKHGFSILVAPGILGTCKENPTTGTYLDTNLSFRSRWQKMMSKKGLPWRSWLILTRRHAGVFWPLYFFWPYFSFLSRRYDFK
jgi:GT2 family glycosyltransferase